jgi:hypothetical protein
MYFKGKLTVDPSQLTKIEKTEPEKSFKKLLFHLTGGTIADKKEVETFKAIVILQQLYMSLKSTGVSNIIRLTHDDLDIYFDREGLKDDFEMAVDKYQIELNEAMSEHFKTIWMVLEHEDNTFKYLIELSVNRSHKVKEYPIDIQVSALLKEFSTNNLNSEEALKEKMKNLFTSQEQYNDYINGKKINFESFLNSLMFELKKQIKADNIKMESKARLIVQKERKDKKEKIREFQESRDIEYGGMPYGYFGFGEFLLYSYLWSELAFDNHIHIADTEIMADTGDAVADIGAEGIDADEGSLLDYNQDFEDRVGSFEDTGGGEDLADIGGDTDSSDSWFDSVFDGGDGGFDFDFDF